MMMVSKGVIIFFYIFFTLLIIPFNLSSSSSYGSINNVSISDGLISDGLINNVSISDGATDQLAIDHSLEPNEISGRKLSFRPRRNEWRKLKDNWNHENQNMWPLMYQSCSGIHQSPINLIDICIQPQSAMINKLIYDPSMKLFFHNYDQLFPPGSFRVTNNGHTVQVVLRRSSIANSWMPKVSGSACNFDVYQFHQLHFHWHQNDLDGSEHAINGQRGAVEMHLVHFNTKYNNVNQASNHADGLLVLGTMFKVTTDLVPKSRMLDPIIRELHHVTRFNSSSLVMKQLRLRTFVPKNTSSYYRYIGSLTTPPCSETVTWILFTRMEGMSLDQLEAFDELDNKENDILMNTNRHLQPLNDRLVYISNLDHCSDPKYFFL